MNELKKDIRRASNQNSAILLILLLLVFIFSIVLSVLKENGILKNVMNYNLLISGVFQYLIALPLAILDRRRAKHGKSIPRLKQVWRKPQASGKEIARWIIISLFFIYAVTYFSNALFTLIQSLTGTELHAIDFAADNTAMSRFTNILLIMFLAPLFEEILFRGIMVENSGKYGTWSSIIACGIMFGLFHMNYAQTLYTIAMGVCAGFLIVKTKSIFPPILLHFCMNTVGAVQSIFIGGIDMEQLAAGNEKYIEENIVQLMPILIIEILIFAVVVTGLVFFISELTKHKETFQLDNKCNELSEQKKLGIYFTAPVTIITTILLIAMTIGNAVI